jgi:hypothetical protein
VRPQGRDAATAELGRFRRRQDAVSRVAAGIGAEVDFGSVS